MSKKNILKAEFDAVQITQKEIDSGLCKAKWYKRCDSEEEFLAMRPDLEKVRDGVYRKKASEIETLSSELSHLKTQYEEQINDLREEFARRDTQYQSISAELSNILKKLTKS